MQIDEAMIMYTVIIGLFVILMLVMTAQYIKSERERRKEMLLFQTIKWDEYTLERKDPKYFKNGKVLPYKEALKKGYVPQKIKDDKSGARLTSSGYETIQYIHYSDFGGDCGGGDYGGGGD